jgi:hypothetical protein
MCEKGFEKSVLCSLEIDKNIKACFIEININPQNFIENSLQI